MPELPGNIWDEVREINDAETRTTTTYPRTFRNSEDQGRAVLREERLTETERGWVRQDADRHELDLRVFSVLHHGPTPGRHSTASSYNDNLMNNINILWQRTNKTQSKYVRNASLWPREDQKANQRYNLSLLQQQYHKILNNHAQVIEQTKGVDSEEAMILAKRAAGGLVLKAENRLAKALEAEEDHAFVRPSRTSVRGGSPRFLEEIITYWELAGTNDGLLPVWEYVKDEQTAMSQIRSSPSGTTTDTENNIQKGSR